MSQYTYSRGRDGAFDTFDIRDPQGDVISSIYFCDAEDGIEATLAEKSAKIICEQFNEWWIGEDPATTEAPRFAVFQLAPDHATYGPDAGKFIVTSADHEQEHSGPMFEDDAKAFAGVLNALTAAERFIRGFEGDELQEGADELLAEIRAALPAETAGRSA